MGKIFVLGDLHFSLGSHKPMDIFGSSWENHSERIADCWKRTVGPDDVVVVNGDISWGLGLEEAVPDLIFLDSLPGTKILMKGNHELWWSTCGKLRQVCREHGLETLLPLFNNAYYLPEKNVLLCGTRGWKLPEDRDFGASDAKVYRRELLRAEATVKYGRKLAEKYGIFKAREARGENPSADFCRGEILGPETVPPEKEPEILFFLHYPPFDFAKRDLTAWTEFAENQGIERVWFGHVHGMGSAKRGENGTLLPVFAHNGVVYYLTSADYLGMKPAEIPVSFPGESDII